MQLVERHRLRRLLTVTGVLVATLVTTLTLPLTWSAAVVVDRLRGQRHRPRETALRVLVLGLWHEVRALGRILNLTVARRGRRRDAAHEAHTELMRWYCMGLLERFARASKTTLEFNTGPISPTPVVVAARHTSFVDAMVPGAVIGQRGLLPAHVITLGLRWSPAIDIVSDAIPTVYIQRRAGDATSTLDEIAAMATTLDDRHVPVIFPEGTFRNPDRFARAVAALERQDPELATRAAELAHTLPPRHRGLWQLLQAQPDAALVICLNQGLERYDSIDGLLTAGRSTDPIRVETWRYEREEIPETETDFRDWLFEQWALVDAWAAPTCPSED